ncbi:hypothetical protein GBAR_LOCUS17201 [Geodia barretti]|uniref:Uncharacterized protein n=1 Tax=Geodia barretti TaxID=519541 RepID=A0AA35WQQ5_GEOBA|nr:hypothetical protein GBAR_LOCUS17201 [Geodia barretti]
MRSCLTVVRSDGTSQVINYSVNIEREAVTLPPVVSTSSSFSIPQTQFLTGDNTLTLTILITCMGPQNVSERSSSIIATYSATRYSPAESRSI